MAFSNKQVAQINKIITKLATLDFLSMAIAQGQDSFNTIIFNKSLHRILINAYYFVTWEPVVECSVAWDYWYLESQPHYSTDYLFDNIEVNSGSHKAMCMVVVS